ncbi:MAG: serine protease [Rhizobiaceae bacterium]
MSANRILNTLAMSAALSVAFVSSSFAQEEYQRPELNPAERVTAAREAALAEQADSGDRVFGGNEADKGEWPFQVALLYSPRLDSSAASQAQAQFCGASLIAPNWVLTAAHCLSDGQVGEWAPRPSDVTVLVGATALTEGRRFKPEKFFVNEGWTGVSVDNDIALIKLAEATSTPTIALPSGPDPDTGKAMVIGWGLVEGGVAPVDLMETEIEMVPNATCNSGLKSIYKNDLQRLLKSWASKMRFSDDSIASASEALAGTMADPLTDNMMCAGLQKGGRDACNGDSGGPLFVQTPEGNRQLGIVSWGDGPVDADLACGHENAWGVYTRISRYSDWIETVIAANGGRAEPGAADGGEAAGGSDDGVGTAEKPAAQ